MNAHHADENIDQLSSQTATSPQYMSKSSHETVSDRQPVLDGAVETDSESAMPTRLDKRTLEPNSHSTFASNADDLSKEPHMNGNGNPTTPHTTGMRKRHELGAEHHIYRYRSRAPAKTMKPLMDPRLYRNTYIEPMHSYYDKAMRRSAHRVVSATTRFDRVTSGALALLADIARMYLVRIGEACRARADLANRSEPNVYDVIDLGVDALNVDWSSLCKWTNEWKSEVCDKVPDPAQEANHNVASSEPPINAAECTGLDANWLGRGSIEDIIDSLDMDRLLLEDSDAKNASDEAIPAHLPPLLSISDDESSEDQSKDVLPPVPALSKDTNNVNTQNNVEVSKTDTKYADRPMSPESDGEETPESIAAHILHITSTALSTLPTSVTSNKSLYAFFRPSSKPDASCAPAEILPTFDVPDTAMVETPDFIKEKLSRREKLPAGMPMFLAAASDQRDVLGDVEKQWREARVKLYEDIYEDAAEMALEEMENAPLPVRRPQTLDSEDEKDNVDHLPPTEVHEHSAEPTHIESGLDMNIDEDVMEMDLGMDLDLDIDVVNGISDVKGEESEDLREPVQKSQLQTNGKDQLQTESADNLEENLEEIPLPVTSGLRGSGVPNWSNEWFTSAMGKRLSQMTAHDILPCDSLYLSKPLQQHVLDEMAQAYVDSEG
ncbi:hypothetical protein IWW36_004407, partial [Coemansia brasiliensis]